MDFSKVDKDGKKLESVSPPANQKVQAGHYEWWVDHPEFYEPSAEDIKCELQLSPLQL